MHDIYLCCIGIGLVILVITLALDSIESLAGFLDFDFFDIDVGDFDICILPISMRALCFASILFGSFGLLLSNLPLVITNAVSGVVAYLGAVSIQSFTKYLKKHQSEAKDRELVKYNVCRVVNTIPANGFGSIVADRIDDSAISLTAKSFDGVELKQDTRVRIIDIKDDYVVVKPF